jgi:hypothetical protein
MVVARLVLLTPQLVFIHTQQKRRKNTLMLHTMCRAPADAGNPNSRFSFSCRGAASGHYAALRVFDSRAHDGAIDREPYRPRTQPGVYVPTATMVSPTWPTLKPFVLERYDQFRPGPPVALASKDWAADYDEVKLLGARDSATRTPEQAATARFWLMTGPPAYHPIARQLIEARHLNLIESSCATCARSQRGSTSAVPAPRDHG